MCFSLCENNIFFRITLHFGGETAKMGGKPHIRGKKLKVKGEKYGVCDAYLKLVRSIPYFSPFTLHLTSDVVLEVAEEEYLGDVAYGILGVVFRRDPCGSHISYCPYTSCTRESSLHTSRNCGTRPCDTYGLRGDQDILRDTLRGDGDQDLKGLLHLLLRKLHHYQCQTLHLKVYELNHLLKLKLLPSPIA